MKRLTVRQLIEAFKKPKVAEPIREKEPHKMADIRVHHGKVFFQVDNTLAAILTEAFPERIEYVRVTPAVPLPTVWEYYVGKVGASGKVALHRRKGAEMEVLTTTDAKQAKHAWPQCPADVIELFAQTPLKDKAGWR